MLFAVHVAVALLVLCVRASGARLERDMGGSGIISEDVFATALSLLELSTLFDIGTVRGKLARETVLGILSGDTNTVSTKNWLETISTNDSVSVASTTDVHVALVPASFRRHMRDALDHDILLARTVHAFLTISMCVVWLLSVPVSSRAMWHETRLSHAALDIPIIDTIDAATVGLTFQAYAVASRVKSAFAIAQKHPFVARALLCDLPAPVCNEIVNRLSLAREHSKHLQLSVTVLLEHFSSLVIASHMSDVAEHTPLSTITAATISGTIANQMIYRASQDNGVLLYDRSASVLLLDILDQLQEIFLLRSQSPSINLDSTLDTRLLESHPLMFESIVSSIARSFNTSEYSLASRIAISTSIRWSLRFCLSAMHSPENLWLPAPRIPAFVSDIQSFVTHEIAEFLHVLCTNDGIQSPETGHAPSKSVNLSLMAEATLKVSKRMRVLLSWRAASCACATLADVLPKSVSIQMLGRLEFAHGTSVLSLLETFASNVKIVETILRRSQSISSLSDSGSVTSVAMSALDSLEQLAIARLDDLNELQLYACEFLWDRYIGQELKLSQLRKSITGFDLCESPYAPSLPTLQDLLYEVHCSIDLSNGGAIASIYKQMSTLIRGFLALQRAFVFVKMAAPSRTEHQMAVMHSIVGRVLGWPRDHAFLFTESLFFNTTHGLPTFSAFCNHFRAFNEWRSHSWPSPPTLQMTALAFSQRCLADADSFLPLIEPGATFSSHAGELAASVRAYTGACFARDMWQSADHVEGHINVTSVAMRYFGRQNTIVGAYVFDYVADFVSAMQVQRHQDALIDFLVHHRRAAPPMRLVQTQPHPINAIWTASDRVRLYTLLNTGHIVQYETSAHPLTAHGIGQSGAMHIYHVADQSELALWLSFISDERLGAQEQSHIHECTDDCFSSHSKKRQLGDICLDDCVSLNQRSIASRVDQPLGTSPVISIDTVLPATETTYTLPLSSMNATMHEAPPISTVPSPLPLSLRDSKISNLLKLQIRPSNSSSKLRQQRMTKRSAPPASHCEWLQFLAASVQVAPQILPNDDDNRSTHLFGENSHPPAKTRLDRDEVDEEIRTK